MHVYTHLYIQFSYQVRCLRSPHQTHTHTHTYYISHQPPSILISYIYLSLHIHTNTYIYTSLTTFFIFSTATMSSSLSTKPFLGAPNYDGSSRFGSLLHSDLRTFTSSTLQFSTRHSHFRRLGEFSSLISR